MKICLFVLLYLKALLLFTQANESTFNKYSMVNQFIEYKNFQKFTIHEWAYDMDSLDYYGGHKAYGCLGPIKASVSFKELCFKLKGEECDLSDQINSNLRYWNTTDLNYKIQKPIVFIRWWNSYLQDFRNLFNAKNIISIGQAIQIDESNYLIPYYIQNRFYIMKQEPIIAHIVLKNKEIITVNEF